MAELVSLRPLSTPLPAAVSRWRRSSSLEVRWRKPSSFILLRAARRSSGSRSAYLELESDEEEEEEDKARQAGNGVEELAWVRRARELAIETMSSRNFTDRDFEALLPPKLRESSKKKRRKPKSRNDEETKAVLKQVKQRRKKSNQGDDASGSVPAGSSKVSVSNPAEPLDPEAVQALARKFSSRTKPGYMDQVAEGEPEMSVEYPSDEASDNDCSEFEEDGEMVISKDSRMREIHLNQDLVSSRDIDEVLESVSRAAGRFRLSPINVATALHRIAKHMVSSGMSETKRLRIARQRDMSELVALAMELLPSCSAQGLSNIAWALSKIGGHLLYAGEMELIAAAGIERLDELNSQNVANIAGAFASMQHSSGEFFGKLVERAAVVADRFRPQELAQVLWAFAALGHPADTLLDSLDEVLLQHRNGVLSDFGPTLSSITSVSEMLDRDEDEDEDDHKNFMNGMTIEQLSSIAWSYAVFNQLQRPFFAYICEQISKSSLNQSNIQTGQHSHPRELSQLYQTSLSLKLEWNRLGLSLGDRVEKLAAAAWEKEKNSSKSTSLFQKDMDHFLVCTGRKWLAEYRGADYTLDFALVDEKIGIEVNGPSHFSRNTGTPLGHMLLKRRLLQASGWKVLSVSYEEWEALQGEAEHVDYVKNLVGHHL